MNVTLTGFSAQATEWQNERDAFAALVEACASYPNHAFRLQSGALVGTYRVGGWNISYDSGVGRKEWLKLEA